MTSSMKPSRLAYRCRPGIPALRNDIVDIFNSDSFCIPATVHKQKRFNEKWVKSITKIKTGNKIHVGPMFKAYLFIAGAVLLGCTGLYRWLTNDNGSETVWMTLGLLSLVFFTIPLLPIFEVIHKPVTKIRGSGKKVSIEEQLRVLSTMGIVPYQKDFALWIRDEFDSDSIESAPYDLLLNIMGSEYRLKSDNDKWSSLSDDILTFQTECIEGHDIYAYVFKHLAILSKGVFKLSDVSGEINHGNKSASVSFTLNGKSHVWQLRYDDCQVDVQLISRINSLLKSIGSEKLFYMTIPRQSMCIVFNTDEIIVELNRLVNTPFFLDVYNSDKMQNFSYSLRTNKDLYSSNMLCTGLLGSILSGFDSDPDDFMVLQPDEPINSCTFLQATKSKKKNTKKNTGFPYILEAGFGSKNRSVAFYRLSTTDKSIVLQFLINYWQNRETPDISSWEDISGELS